MQVSPQSAIEFEHQPSGELKLTIVAKREQFMQIKGLIEQMVQDVQENAYTVREKIRDIEIEDEDQSQFLESETVRVEVEININRRFKKSPTP